MNPNDKDMYVDYMQKLIDNYNFIDPYKQQKIKIETDEEKLDKMDIKTIETYLRKKKLQNLSTNK